MVWKISKIPYWTFNYCDITTLSQFGLSRIFLKLQGNDANVQRLTESLYALEDQVKALTRIILQQCKSLDELIAHLNERLNSVPSDPNAKAMPNHGSKQCGLFDPQSKNNYKSPKLRKRTPYSIEDDPDYKPTMHTSFTTDHLAFGHSKKRKGSSKKTSKPIAKTGQTNVPIKVIIFYPH